ncbi:hypothetical protein D3C81_1889000 [compost metagenome]
MANIMQPAFIVVEAEEQGIHQPFSKGHSASHSGNIRDDFTFLPAFVLAAQSIGSVDVLAYDTFQTAALRRGEQLCRIGIAWHVLDMGMWEQHLIQNLLPP